MSFRSLTGHKPIVDRNSIHSVLTALCLVKLTCLSLPPLSLSPDPVLLIFLLTEFDQLSNNATIALTGRLDTIQLRLSLSANIEGSPFFTHLP